MDNTHTNIGRTAVLELVFAYFDVSDEHILLAASNGADCLRSYRTAKVSHNIKEL